MYFYKGTALAHGPTVGSPDIKKLETTSDTTLTKT